MIPLDIISGFLGAGKTTLINKLMEEAYSGERLAILENEFGEVGVDGELLAGPNITVKEIANGCICCSLQGSFVDGLRELAALGPQRIVVEPTGMGSLREVCRSVETARGQGVQVAVNAMVTVVNAVMLPAFLEIGGSFFSEQIEDGPVVVLSAVQQLGPDEPIEKVVRQIRRLNDHAALFTECWDELDALHLLAVAEQKTGVILQSGRLNTVDRHEEDHAHHHDHPPDHGHEEGTFDSYTFLPSHGCAATAFAALLDEMAAGKFGRVIRGKGFVTLDGQPSRLNYVYGRFTVEPAPARQGDRLVFIGEPMDAQQLEHRLQELLTT